MNPYKDFVAGLAQLIETARQVRLESSSRPHPGEPRQHGPTVVMFSPHPDDECVTAALALRLRRECGYRIANVAVTLGSRKERREARRRELVEACRYLGFELLELEDGGLEDVTPGAVVRDHAAWTAKQDLVVRILETRNPDVVAFPHRTDWHPIHKGTHLLVRGALKRMGPAFSCYTVETEFWRPLATPNVMVESSVDDVAELVRALSCHRGEINRNPYHLRLPAAMVDNVRRYELIAGAGCQIPGFMFATLYRICKWQNGRTQTFLPRGAMLAQAEEPSQLFPELATFR